MIAKIVTHIQFFNFSVLKQRDNRIVMMLSTCTADQEFSLSCTHCCLLPFYSSVLLYHSTYI